MPEVFREVLNIDNVLWKLFRNLQLADVMFLKHDTLSFLSDSLLMRMSTQVAFRKSQARL